MAKRIPEPEPFHHLDARISPPRGKPDVSVVFVCHDGEGRILLARRGPGARDEPGAAPDDLPSPLHSQLPATLAV